ncbi:MAG: cellulase family glycosylhydrolase [Deltaproteobacteria bacterium]|nr:cellulase family glycosylhydrolase [Deltaproteobacteria bacterium]
MSGLPQPDAFVRAVDGGLQLGGRPFRFMGTNCYFLQEEGARQALGWEGYAGRVDEALAKAAALGMQVVRAWAFHDDPENPAALQPAPGRTNPAGLAGVDLALRAAREHGLRLILSLINYWPDYGGVAQYLRWHGLPATEPQRFFTEPALRAHFGDHVQGLLERVNPLTGLAWGCDPCVLAWELMNEPRGAGLDPNGEAMADWVAEMAGRVRASASQLVATGEEGSGPGTDFERNSLLVDLASIHLYPENWAWPREHAEADGVAWIERHAEAAARSQRPLVLGEFGLRNDGLALEARRRIYSSWIETALARPAVAGACSWSFSTDDRPDGWDAFGWTWRDGTQPADACNRYADLHRDWSRRFAATGSAP